MNIVPPRTRLRTVICRNSGTSRLEDEFILSNLEWPHKPHKPAGLWGDAYGVLGTLDLCIPWSGMILRDSYPGRSYPPFALAVLGQGKMTER